MAGRAPDIIFRHRLSPEVQLSCWHDAGEFNFTVQKRFYDKKIKGYRATTVWFLRDIMVMEHLCREAQEYVNQTWRNLTPEQRAANRERMNKKFGRTSRAESRQYSYREEIKGENEEQVIQADLAKALNEEEHDL